MAIPSRSASGTAAQCRGSSRLQEHLGCGDQDFDDRILFTNPGRIYGNLTIEDLKRDDYVSSIRNKLLAEAFYLTGDIEKYGTGFIRIREWLRGYPHIKLDISEMGDFFRVDIRSNEGGGENDLRNDLKNDLREQYGLTDNQAGYS